MKKGIDKLKLTLFLFSIIIFLAIIPLISSQTYDLKIPTNETSCNVTITFLNSSDFVVNKGMTIGVGYGNYTLNYPAFGEYKYFSNCGSGTFNPNGETLSTGTSLIYLLVTIFSLLIFGIVTWIFLNINGENPQDETGYLGINYRKYVKTALFPLVYVLFIWCFNFIIGLSNNYLGLTLYQNTLEFMFLILMKLVIPVIIITAIIELVLMVKDSNIKKEYKSLWNQY